MLPSYAVPLYRVFIKRPLLLCLCWFERVCKSSPLYRYTDSYWLWQRKLSWYRLHILPERWDQTGEATLRIITRTSLHLSISISLSIFLSPTLHLITSPLLHSPLSGYIYHMRCGSPYHPHKWIFIKIFLQFFIS